MKRHTYYFKQKLKSSLVLHFDNLFLKFLQYRSDTPETLKQRSLNILDKKLKKRSFVRLKKFCIRTGRLRFLIHQSPYSRITFREMARDGYSFGLYKNSR